MNASPRRAEWQAGHLGQETNELLSRDANVFLHQSLSTPCLNAIGSADGSRLHDLEGNAYLDFHGNSVHQVGYGNKRVVEATIAALQELPFCPRRYTNERAVRLAESLADLCPIPQARALFAPGGAEAMGIALKLARLVTKRHKTISMWGSFHGAGLDTASIGGERLFRSGMGPLLSGTEHVPPPDPRRCPLGCGSQCTLACASYLEYVLEQEGDVAAVIAEPIRSTTAILPPPDYWPRIRQACDRQGALLIFDEVPTCLGRTGHYFASELTGVIPDMVVVGKGLGGGVFPLAAVLAKNDLNVAGNLAIGHYTHEKSPIGAAAGLAVLAELQDGLLDRAILLGQDFLAELRRRTTDNPRVISVRGIGLLMAVELDNADYAEAVLYASLSRGLSFKVSSEVVLTLTPPLTLSDSEASEAIEILVAALDECL